MLVAVNVAVWLLITATGGAFSVWVEWLGLRAQGICVPPGQPEKYFPEASAQACADLGLWYPGVSDGAPWQLMSSAFVHVDPTHLGLNMLALLMLGPVLDRQLGTLRFLLVYFVSALAGSVTVYLLAPPDALTYGASGGVFGLLGALLVVSWWLGGDARAVLIWLAINVVYTFLGHNISWQGHLGGLGGGVLITALLLARTPRRRRSRR